MLSGEECQFTMTQLIEAVQICDIIPHEDTIKNHLKKSFGNQIVISSRIGGVTYVCFSTKLFDILTHGESKNQKLSKRKKMHSLTLLPSSYVEKLEPSYAMSISIHQVIKY